jgi:ABC-type transport system substrate-binding protein
MNFGIDCTNPTHIATTLRAPCGAAPAWAARPSNRAFLTTKPLLPLGMERSRSEGLDVAWNALQTNADGSNKVTPWLATGSVWSPDFKTLTFTIRSGVNWSDGHYWFLTTLNVSLFPNLKNSLLSNVAVRKAISLALTASTDRASTGTASASAPAVASRPGSGGWPRRRPGRGACRAPRRRGR